MAKPDIWLDKYTEMTLIRASRDVYLDLKVMPYDFFHYENFSVIATVEMTSFSINEASSSGSIFREQVGDEFRVQRRFGAGVGTRLVSRQLKIVGEIVGLTCPCKRTVTYPGEKCLTQTTVSVLIHKLIWSTTWYVFQPDFPFF